MHMRSREKGHLGAKHMPFFPFFPPMAKGPCPEEDDLKHHFSLKGITFK
jgi:hypothetical protein